MGRLALEGMLHEGPDRRTVLEWHLKYNHYPPHPAFMVDVAEAAIEACEAGEPERAIPLPAAVEHKKYGNTVPASVVIESLHLGEFLEQEDGE